APSWVCAHCGAVELRAPVIGQRRTVEELGRAFPQVPIRSSVGGSVLRTVGPEPAIVVATPGAAPRARGGYAAALLMDAWVMLGRADLRTAEESLRRWLNASAQVRTAGDGGEVLVLGDAGHPAVQAVVRSDPAGYAARELEDRRESRFPPAVRLATIEGRLD